jgi:hypothetical protein
VHQGAAQRGPLGEPGTHGVPLLNAGPHS